MLVLTRKVGEKLVIGNEIIVEVLSVNGEGIRLGITAPRETSVHRHEVYTEIQAANSAATAAATNISNNALENLAAHIRTTQP